MISEERILALLSPVKCEPIKQSESIEICQLALEALKNRNSGAKAADIEECTGIEPDAPRTQANENAGMFSKFSRNTE